MPSSLPTSETHDPRRALSPEQAARVLHIHNHQRKNRIGRYIAVAGWMGLIRLAVAIGFTTAFGLLNALIGDVLPLVLCAVAPAALGAAIGVAGRAHVWLVRKNQNGTRLMFNALTVVSLAALFVVAALLNNQYPRLLALMFCVPMTLVWIGFWAYSDKAILPHR